MAMLQYYCTRLMRKEENDKPTELFRWLDDRFELIIEEADEMANTNLTNANMSSTPIAYDGNDYYLEFEFDIVDDEWGIIDNTIHHRENATNMNDAWDLPMAIFNKKTIIENLKKQIAEWKKHYEKDSDQHN